MSASHASADPDWSLIARHLAGAATTADEQALTAWIGDDLARRQLVSTLRTAWVAAGSQDTAWADPDELWAKVRAHLPLALPATAATGSRADRVVSFRRSWPRGVGLGARDQGSGRRMAIGTSAALVLGAVFAWRASLIPDPRSWVAADRQYATSTGQRETITLPDGTQCTLAPASRLTLAAGYGRTRREVVLQGSALFAVVHDRRSPFTVRAANTVTTDAGTRFAVRAYDGEAAVRVAVAEGAVTVRGIDDTLRARDVAVVTPSGATTVRRAVDLDADTAWAVGRLVFDATPLPQVLTDLSRWYGVDVRIGDPVLAARHITATIAQPGIASVLDLLAPVIGARYERRGQTYTLLSGSTRAP